MSVAIVVLTHNRLHLLRSCVDNVLSRTSELTREIVIWDNASQDGTREYLDALTDPRVRVVHHPENIGQNAYAPAFELTSADYLIEVDDDIVDAPPRWDATLVDAFDRLDEIGFLAANLVNDPHDTTAQYMYGTIAHLYRVEEVSSLRLKLGPVGGGCTITSRDLYERVGGFRQDPKQVFWLEDAAYIEDIKRLGYSAAYLEDLRVHHAGGPYYAESPPEKVAYWADYWRRVERRNTLKRRLLRVPFVRPLNQHFGWFQAPPESA
jgi:GT2 family glycosyltransferase